MFLDKVPSVKNTELSSRVAAFAASLLILFILLLTATEALCFWVPNWWRNEYAKYDTPSNVRGEMSLDDAVHVTEDMLDYCVGRLDTLDDTEAVIDGVSAPFFTDREKPTTTISVVNLQSFLRSTVSFSRYGLTVLAEKDLTVNDRYTIGKDITR